MSERRCTGLKDKEGKLIYEGDVFEWKLKKGTECQATKNPFEKMQIDIIENTLRLFGEDIEENKVCEDCTFISEVMYRKKYNDFVLSLIEDRNFTTCFVDSKLKRNELGRVIGNIRDNPELLK